MLRPTSARTSILASLLVIFTSFACTTSRNYLDPEGPRYAADYSVRMPAEAPPGSTLKVVSYNVKYGKAVGETIATLANTPELADADVILLQEMDAHGVDRIARTLGFHYVYYPASLRRSGSEFGNAVLTRGEILSDRKIVLPHANPINRQRRIAVRTDVEVDGFRLPVVSVHVETPYLMPESRADQVRTVLTALETDDGACLVAGDFNTLANKSLAQFDELFAGAGFERVSDGVGATLSAGPFRFRADHVFARDLDVVAFGKIEGAEASDHLPVWVELATR